MNIKRQCTHNYQQLNTNKLSKQAEQKQNHRYGDHLEGYQLEEGRWRMREKVQELSSTNWQVQNRQKDVKNSIGNREVKELICMTHGHEIRGGIAGGNWSTGQRGHRGKSGTTVIA